MKGNRTKVLVTGGAGFIGSHLVERLLSLHSPVILSDSEGSTLRTRRDPSRSAQDDRGACHVTCVDSFDPFYDPAIKEKNIAAVQRDSRFRLERVDICDRKELERVFHAAQPDVVLHLAARAGVRPSIKNPLAYHRTNVEGTLNVLECARDVGVRKIVFGSSSSVYGVSSKLPFAENDPLHCPISPYAATKIAGESLCRVFNRLHGISMAILRFFTVYGPRQRPEMAIAQFARKIQGGETIELYGDGASLRDYTFVSDIVEGIVAAMEKPMDCEIINLGNAHPVPLKGLIETMESCAKIKAKIRWLPEQPGDVPITYASLARAMRLLDFKPKVGIAEGIKKYLEWTQLDPSAGGPQDDRGPR